MLEYLCAKEEGSRPTFASPNQKIESGSCSSRYPEKEHEQEREHAYEKHLPTNATPRVEGGPARVGMRREKPT